MSNNINQQIEVRVQAFVQELSELVKSAALAAVSGALGGTTSAPAKKQRGRPLGSKNKSSAGAPMAAAKKSKGAGRKRAKRSSDQVEAMAISVYEHVKKNPGQGVEGISKALKTKSKVLTLPITKLLKAKKLKTSGQRRGTKYFAR